MLALTAHAYNVVDLPENMTFSDALGVFNADEITRITVSDIAEGKYTDLTKDEINDSRYDCLQKDKPYPISRYFRKHLYK